MKMNNFTKILVFGTFLFVSVILLLSYSGNLNLLTVNKLNALQTVEIYCQLIEKGDKKTMEQYVTRTPNIYLQQIIDKAEASEIHTSSQLKKL